MDMWVQEEITLESEKMQLQMMPLARGNFLEKFRVFLVMQKRFDIQETHISYFPSGKYIFKKNQNLFQKDVSNSKIFLYKKPNWAKKFKVHQT